MGKSINYLVEEAYQTAVGRGWHDKKIEFGTLLALVHTEVTEAVESKGSEHLAEELADILIRIFDLCGDFQIPLQNSFIRTTGLETMEEIYEYYKTTLKQEVKSESITKHALQIHTLITRVMETYRLALEEDEKNNRLADALASVIGYALQTSHCLNLDDIFIETLYGKMEKNKKRPHKHGGKIV